MRSLLSLSGLTLIAAISIVGLWISHSESGLQTVAQVASQASGGRLIIEQSSGRLTGPFRIAHLGWKSAELNIGINGLHIDWQPAELFQGKLAINEISIDSLRLDLGSSGESSPPPSNLQLPLAVDIEKIKVAQFNWQDIFNAQGISGHFSSDGVQHRLNDLIVSSGNLTLTGEAKLNGSAPLPLSFAAQLNGQLDEHPMRLVINGAGPLGLISLNAKAEQGLNGQLTATITPFAPQSFANAHLELSDLDPVAWHPAAPSAKLVLQADLQPRGEGVAGNFSITNQQPGSLDRQRLPLQKLSGKIAGQGDSMRFDEIVAQFNGGGTLHGDGRWQHNQLSLDLQAVGLDAASLLSQLRPTRLAGTLAATLSLDQQTVQSKLSDPRFALKIDARHAAGIVTLPQLELSAGNSVLKASGELKLAPSMNFMLQGELNRFNPSLFIKAPAALINSRFKGQGKLTPTPQVEAHFEINNSLLAGESLVGQGDLQINWPLVPRADITLKLGANQLKAYGAYGRAGDELNLDINAPQLTAYGGDGGLTAQVRLAGTPQQPTISAQAESSRLRLPGLAQLHGLKIKLLAGGAANAALDLNLAIARLDDDEQVNLARAIHVQAHGTNKQHMLQASADLAPKQKLTLRLQGGLDGSHWQGQLNEAALNGGRQSLQLSAPAALVLTPENWSFGPAQLSGGDEAHYWQGSLQAGANQQLLSVDLAARGPRLGELNGKIKAGMRSPWSINVEAPWQASLKSRIDDLGWLAEFLGEQWKSAGTLSGELNVTGTPAYPLSSGQFRGENLVIRLPEQGLHLTHGALDISVKNNLLQVKKLSFDSLLQTPPRALLLRDKAEVAGLGERPGKLEISGEMLVDRNKLADRAFLDIHLERLGIYQRPDQWVAVSGDGRLSWQENTLGIRGKLVADAGYWQLAKAGTPRLSDDVVVKSPSGEKPVNQLRPKLDLDLSAGLGKNFLFNGAGLSSRLVGDIRLRASGRDLPRASGSIRTRDGRFEAYGQDLSIDRGILTFQGLLDNPALDVHAIRKGLAVEAGVQVSGTALKPIVKLTSDPELPDAEKLAWLILGHGPEQMGGGDATVLLAAAGSILGNDSGGVIKQLKSTFGIDEFGVRQGQIGDAGGRTQSSRVAGSSVDTTASTGNQILSVGKRLSSNAVLSYEQSLGKAESIVKLTVNLTRQISVIGRAGSDNALDLFYTITLGRGSQESR